MNGANVVLFLSTRVLNNMVLW